MKEHKEIKSQLKEKSLYLHIKDSVFQHVLKAIIIAEELVGTYTSRTRMPDVKTVECGWGSGV